MFTHNLTNIYFEKYPRGNVFIPNLGTLVLLYTLNIISMFVESAQTHKRTKLKEVLKTRRNGVFSKWSGTFIEFSEFRESEESPKHELGSV